MDQRKFITFLLLSMAFWLLCMQLFPPPDPAKQQPPAAAEKNGDKAAVNGQAAPAAADDEVQENGEPLAEVEDPLAEEGAQPLAAARPGELQIAQSIGETKYVTIGSLDLNDGYRMLVTLTSSGAAILRAELSSPLHTSQQDWSGYLGELQLKNVADGVRIRVVGDGTPAAQAKLAAEDVITGLKNSKPGEKVTVKSFQAALAKTEPGKEFTLQVKRGDNDPEAKTVRLTRRPFAVLRPEIENFQMREVDPPADFASQPSMLMTIATLNGNPLSKSNAKKMAQLLEMGNWQLAAHDQKSATFTITPVPDLTITKRYTLAQVPTEKREDPNFKAYHVLFDVEFQNTAEEPKTVSYRLDGPTGMPLEGWWYASKISRTGLFKGAGLRDIVVRFDGESGVTQFNCPEIVEGEYPPIQQLQAGLAFAGVDGQYFAAVIIPMRKAPTDAFFETVEPIVAPPPPDPRHATYANTTVRMTRLPTELAAGASHAEQFELFLGPKRPELLAQYHAPNNSDYSLADIVYYGLPLFGYVAKLMLVILHFIYNNIIGNFGIAIIMLTVLVRAAMFPLSYKQTKSMARMQALKPEIDAINEQYKTDMQKRSQATQELYRKHQINPLAGCLPVLLQLPIFMGLYRALMVDVELRGSPLFGESIRWASDLAAPDKFWNWSHIMPGFVQSFLGPYLNIFPLVTVALFLVTQKMSMPPPTNEQAAMQQKMMKYMTIFIGFMFYKVASGLCLYFIVSSLWGIAERKLLPKPQPANSTAGGATGGASEPDGRRPGSGGPRTGPNGKPRTKKPRNVRPKK